jgi:hypothetical protein
MVSLRKAGLMEDSHAFSSILSMLDAELMLRRRRAGARGVRQRQCSNAVL